MQLLLGANVAKGCSLAYEILAGVSVNLYEPIFNLDCAECDRTPCVGFRDDEGSLRCTNLCGVCFFGCRLMEDPEEWNSQSGEL